MKLDQRTIHILKNFSEINKSIVFKPGDTIGTMAEGKNIIAKAKVAQIFEHEFAIYDLGRFLGALSLFKEPEVELHAHSMTIRSGDQELNYIFCEPSLVLQPVPIRMPETIAKFRLQAPNLSGVIKGMDVLKLPQLGFIGDGTTISAQAIDSANPSGDNFKIANLGTTDRTFRFVFKAEVLKMIPGDYDVTITKGIAHLAGNEIDYWIVAEAKFSKF